MTKRLDSADESIFFELEWLESAIDTDRGRHRAARIPLRRPYGRTMTATIVATSVLLPRAVLAGTLAAPAQGATGQPQSQADAQRPASGPVSIVRVVDADTGKPLSGARILDRLGRLVGLTKADGRTTIAIGQIAGGEATVQHDGYRTFPLVVSTLKPGATVFVGLSAQPGQTAATPVYPSAMSLRPSGSPVSIRKPPVAQTAAKPVAKHPPKQATKPATKPRTIAVKASAAPSGAVAFHLSEHSTPAKPAVAAKHSTPARPAVAAKHSTPAKPAVAAKHSTPARPVRPPHLTHPRHSPVVEQRAPQPAVRPVHEASRPKAVATPSATYRVHLGDTLWAISAHRLGNPTLWGQLYRANRDQISDPDLIHPGQILRIPTPILAHSSQLTHHVSVKSGDSLWRLAADHLGDGALWPRIYRLNRHVVSDPDLIYPGEVLTLPSV